MSNHFVSINRGVDGFKSSDFTTGTSSTTTDDVELRVADAANLTPTDINKLIEALERFFQDAVQVKAAGFAING